MIRPCKLLAQIDWLRLVEISPARYLLVIPSGMQVEVLEIAIHDLLADLTTDSEEMSLLKELQHILSHQRRQSSISKAELLFVDVPVKN